MDVNSFVIGYTKGKQSAGGGGSGGGAELNIAYGDTPPEDTTKLWVKTGEPSGVIVSNTFNELGGNFTTLTPNIPVALYASFTLVNDKVYTFGGGGSSGNVTTITCFDMETTIVTTLSAKLPKATNSMATGVLGTKVYLLGGWVSGAYCFDTETETLSTISVSMPCNPCMDMSWCVIGNKIYIFGGSNNGSTRIGIKCFDMETETLTTLPNTNFKNGIRYGCAAVGTKVYLFGGSVSAFIDYSDTIQCFDSITQVTTTLPTSMPYVAGKISCCAIDTTIYLFGGENTSMEGIDTIMTFDSKTESLVVEDLFLPKALHSMRAILYGTKIYLFGGSGGTNLRDNNYNVYVLETKPKAFDKQGTLGIITTENENIFLLINTESASVSMGVRKVFTVNVDGELESVEAYLYKDGAWTTI